MDNRDNSRCGWGVQLSIKSFELLQIEKYGVILQRLTKEDIELVRNWRNDPKISKHMSFRSYITSEMQEAWFESINSSGVDFYFIIQHGEDKVGLANIKNVSWSDKTGESGIFIYDDSYSNSLFPFRSSSALLDFAFYELELNALVCHILKNNYRAIRYNQKFGFTIGCGQSEIQNQKYILTKQSYETNMIFVRQFLLKTTATEYL